MKINKPIIVLFVLALIISFMIGVSYAYFSPVVVGNDNVSTNLATSATLRLNFDGTNSINLINIEPGEFASSTFTVTNSGNAIINAYEVYFSNVINELSVKSEMVYTISCISSDAIPCNNVTQTEVPDTSMLVLTQSSIAPNTTHTYTLTITFLSMPYLQDYNQEKEVSFKITINELVDEQIEYQTLLARQAYGSTELFWGYSTSITEIIFEDSINIPGGATASWDVSVAQEGKIMAYIIDDGLGTNTYELHIQAEYNVILANPNGDFLFQGFTELTNFINLNYLDTSNVTTMDSMFYYCSSLTSLDLSTFDTSSVTNMSSMFLGCSALTSLDLSSFDTGIVTDMSWMFQGCTSLTTLNLSTFDTSSVTTMSFMFQGCSALTSLDLSTFDTSSVTDMSWMFQDCSSLTSLDFRLADFTIVTTYTNMFSYITSGITITVLDTSAQTWITARLTDAGKTGTVTIY